MTILEFLKMGGRMEFPSGYILKGDTKNLYIDTGFDIGMGYQPDGLRNLDADGVRLAINDEKDFRKQQEK